MTDINKTLAERGERYGAFRDHAAIAQDLKDAMWHRDGWSRLAPDQKQALEVIADKVARILNGDPNYTDNWHDIIGYARLVETRLQEAQAPMPEPTQGNVNREATPPAEMPLVELVRWVRDRLDRDTQPIAPGEARTFVLDDPRMADAYWRAVFDGINATQVRP
jgi:hypothetical protein